jgi:H+/Cl- antiporter ClcA
MLGPYLYLGYPNVKNPDGYIYFGVIAVAIIAGATGSFMCTAIMRIIRWKSTFTQKKNILYIIVSGLIIASIAYFGDDHVLGSGKELMNHTLFDDDKHVNWHSMLVRIFGPVISFNVGGAGGIFAPALAAGASVGGFFSSIAGIAGANANILILSGMVGFLTGVTRTPFTSAILVLEMTDRHSVIFQLMLAGMVANVVALVVDKHSLYEQLKKGYLNEMTTHDDEEAPEHPAPAGQSS